MHNPPRLPFYYIAKLGFLVALWHPSTKLASSIYAKAVAPLVSRCAPTARLPGRAPHGTDTAGQALAAVFRRWTRGRPAPAGVWAAGACIRRASRGVDVRAASGRAQQRAAPRWGLLCPQPSSRHSDT
jgi:hypothetical protein